MVNKQKILIVDDDENIAELISLYLAKECFDTMIVHDGEEALRAFDLYHPNLILLDLMLPGIDGYQVCREIRSRSQTPIIMLSAKGEVFDKVLGLELGADDYITKPFSPTELLARVDSLYRRVEMHTVKPEPERSDDITLGEFTLNLRRRTLLKNGVNIELTQVEFQMIEYFFTNPDVALDRTDILNKVWGTNYFGEEKIVDVNIRRLRMKIEDEPSSPRYLQTVWGLGYVFIPDGSD